MNKFIYILIGLVCIGIAAIFTLFLKKHKKANEKENKEDVSDEERTAQDFTNTIDIDNDGILHTIDGYFMGYVKVEPLSIDLLSSNERKILVRNLTAKLSGFEYAWKFLAISRPVDVSPIINSYQAELNVTGDIVRRKLLRSSIMELSNFAMNGEVVERQFVFCLWQEAKNKNSLDILKKSLNNMQRLLSSSNVKAMTLERPEVIRLLNLFNNPTASFFENNSEIDSDILSVDFQYKENEWKKINHY